MDLQVCSAMIWGLSLLISLTNTMPVKEKSGVTRSEFAETYRSLKKPLSDILEVTRSTATNFAKERKLEGIKMNEALREMCQSYIGKSEIKHSKERQKRFIYVMRVYQELIKELQKIQIGESKLHGGKCSEFLKKLRTIEFKLRDFVETKLRNAARDVVQADSKKLIPAYSIGNKHLVDVKDSKAYEVNKNSLETLNAVMLCSENFMKNEVMQVAGDGRVLKEEQKQIKAPGKRLYGFKDMEFRTEEKNGRERSTAIEENGKASPTEDAEIVEGNVKEQVPEHGTEAEISTLKSEAHENERMVGLLEEALRRRSYLHREETKSGFGEHGSFEEQTQHENFDRIENPNQDAMQRINKKLREGESGQSDEGNWNEEQTHRGKEGSGL